MYRNICFDPQVDIDDVPQAIRSEIFAPIFHNATTYKLTDHDDNIIFLALKIEARSSCSGVGMEIVLYNMEGKKCLTMEKFFFNYQFHKL